LVHHQIGQFIRAPTNIGFNFLFADGRGEPWHPLDEVSPGEGVSQLRLIQSPSCLRLAGVKFEYPIDCAAVTQSGAGREESTATSFNGLEFLSSVSRLASPLFQSRALGVGKSAAVISNLQAPDPLSDSSPALILLSWASLASMPDVVTRGVSHSATSSVRFAHPCFVPWRRTLFGSPAAVSWAWGVVQSFVAPVSESTAPGWFPQLSASSERGDGHCFDITLRLVIALRGPPFIRAFIAK
jgi:hypothetical protein